MTTHSVSSAGEVNSKVQEVNIGDYISVDTPNQEGYELYKVVPSNNGNGKSKELIDYYGKLNARNASNASNAGNVKNNSKTVKRKRNNNSNSQPSKYQNTGKNGASNTEPQNYNQDEPHGQNNWGGRRKQSRKHRKQSRKHRKQSLKKN